jgi:hypothetical protein
MFERLGHALFIHRELAEEQVRARIGRRVFAQIVEHGGGFFFVGAEVNVDHLLANAGQLWAFGEKFFVDRFCFL